MNFFDWLIIASYMAGMVLLSWFVGRGQRDGRDYYLAGNKLSPLTMALSTMATQCSTNSLLGAPAFVVAVGGLLWLQYELAVPLAMIGVMAFLLPFFRARGVISVYEYLEHRFGPGSRLMLSLLFQFLRAFSTGVTVYGISLVVQTLTGMPFWAAVLLLGAVTVIYDFLGGIKAVIYSDVIQMVLLYSGIVVCLIFATRLAGGLDRVWELFPADKARALDFSGTGLGDKSVFAFWPMLLGGFFLYMSYYGCDQTQVQRELCSRDADGTNMSLFLGGILRFPLVLTYCMVGVALGAFLVSRPEFLGRLADPATGEINYNLLVPVFCLNYLPNGVIGLVMVSLFAAAMSSLDSTINSLSAVTMRDIVARWLVKGELPRKTELLWSRLATVFWGIVCLISAFYAGGISKTIIESINMIGSLINGPVLAVFLLAILTRRARDQGVMIGIIAGFAANLYLWKFHPGVSWLWWNVSGCAVTFGAGYVASLFFRGGPAAGVIDGLVLSGDTIRSFKFRRNWFKYYAALFVYFLVMLAFLAVLTYSRRAG